MQFNGFAVCRSCNYLQLIIPLFFKLTIEWKCSRSLFCALPKLLFMEVGQTYMASNLQHCLLLAFEGELCPAFLIFVLFICALCNK